VTLYRDNAKAPVLPLDPERKTLPVAAGLIRSGGALCGHDYLQHPSGSDTVTDFHVVAAVSDWCRRNGYDPVTDVLTTTDDGFPSFVIRLR